MSGHALQHPGVLILHLALNAAWRKVVSSSVGGIEDRAAGRRAKSRGRHPERRKNLALEPACQMLAHLHLQRLAQQNKARVGVLRARARLGLQAATPGRRVTAIQAWSPCGKTPRSPASPNCGPAGGAVSLGAPDLPGPGPPQTPAATRQAVCPGRSARAAQQHRRSRGGNYLGQAGHVIHRLGSHGGSVFFIGKTAQRVLQAQLGRRPERRTRTQERPAPQSPLAAPGKPRQTGRGPGRTRELDQLACDLIALSHGNARTGAHPKPRQ